MEHITSRGFKLPERPEEMAGELWFNMWERKLWPYEELVVSDILYWYESPSKSIVWKTRVVDIDRFRYDEKNFAGSRLKGRFGDFDRAQPYYVEAPQPGFCLAYKVSPILKVNLSKPPDFQFPRQGWLRLDNEVARKWLSQESVSDDATLDFIVPDGPLGERLRHLNDAMAEVSPLRVRAIVSQTIRRDTRLVRALNELCAFQCQFPGCGTRIPKRDGGFYIEVAHIEPVHQGGRTVLGNLLVLCPNHHKELDYGSLEIVEQTTERVRGKLNGREFDIELPVSTSDTREQPSGAA